jgi:FkbM family methyltransferase
VLADRIIQQIPYSIRRPLRNIYEYSKKRALRDLHSQFIQPGSLIFDIGAHTGYYADSFLNLGANVVCVEPQPYCIQKLKRRFNDVPAVKILEMGVAEKRGELVLHIDLDNIATATFSDKFIDHGPFTNRHWGGEILVPVTTLDDLIVQYGNPGYCKIDVEGYELNVIQGLSTMIPVISFEYFQAFMGDAERCLIHLEQFGEIRMNYAPTFDFTRLKLKKWTQNKQEIFREIMNSSFEYSGDFFVRFD